MAKQVVVKKNGDKLVWLAESNAEGDCQVEVAEGCQAIVLCDGRYDECLMPGRTKINIKSGVIFKKTAYKTCSVYGINTSGEIDIRWGTQVRYIDKKYEISVVIKASGICKARIENGSVLYKKLWDSESLGIDEGGLEEHLRPLVKSNAEGCISKIANAEVSYAGITESKAAIADGIKASLKRLLNNEYGLYLTNTIVNFNEFEGLEEIWRLEKVRAESEIRTSIAEAESAQTQAAAAAIKATAEAVNTFGEKAEQQPAKKDKIDLLKKEDK